MFFKRKKSSTPADVKAQSKDQRQLPPAVLSARTVSVDSEGQAVSHPELFALWQTGDLRPTAITLAFDPEARGGRGALYSSTPFVGAWVDVACGAHEPAVDRWEQGLLYPSWDQLCRLALLTQTPLNSLFNGVTNNHVVGGCMRDPMTFALRHSFHPSIVAATVSSHPQQTSLEDMATAINEAITDIRASIAAGTDPLTVYIDDLLGESGLTGQ